MRTHGRTGPSGWAVAGALVLGLASGGAGLAGAQQAPPAPASPPQAGRLLTPEDRAAMAQIFWSRAQVVLGLTDQQVAEIRTLLEGQRTAVRGDVQALVTARRQLQELLGQSTADSAAIQAAAAQVKALRDSLFDRRLQTQLALRAKLTPEQLTRWIELRRGMGPRGWRRGGAFGQGGM